MSSIRLDDLKTARNSVDDAIALLTSMREYSLAESLDDTYDQLTALIAEARMVRDTHAQ